MTSTATVTRIGNSRGVVIPKSFGDDFLPVGTSVIVEKDAGGAFVVRPVVNERARRLAALDDLEQDVAQSPRRAPWSDDSPETDRALLQARYV